MTSSESQYGTSDAPAAPPSTQEGRRILTGTIVWGVILLVVAALYGFQAAAQYGLVDVEISPAWVVLGLGALLVLGGLVAALSRRR